MDRIFRPKAVKGSISTEQWNDARPLIERLYLKENRRFSYVADALMIEHGFLPTKRQYDRIVGSKWKLRKNTTVQQRRLAVEQLGPEKMGFDQAHSDVWGITRPVNISKMKRWKKNLAKNISLAIGHERSIPEQMSIYQGYVLPELQRSEEMKEFDLWNCTRVHDSPNLTALFVTFGILDLGPSDVDIPEISLFTNSESSLATEEDQCISPLDIFAPHITALGKVHENATPCSNGSTLRVLVEDPIPTREGHPLIPPGWDHTSYNDGFCQRELYPFRNASDSRRHVHSTRKIHQPLAVLKDKFERLVRLFPTNHNIILCAGAELRDEYLYQGDIVGIVPVLDKLLSVMEHAHGLDDSRTLRAHLDLIDNLGRRGLWLEAAAQQNHIHQKIVVKHSTNYILLARSLALLSKQAGAIGKHEEEERLKRQVLQINLNMHGVKHKDTLEAMRTLGLSLTRNGSLPLAEKLLNVTTQVHHHIPGLSAEEFCRNLKMLARYFIIQKMFSQANLSLKRAMAHAENLPVGHPQFLSIMHCSALVNALQGQGSMPQGMPLSREVIRETNRRSQVMNHRRDSGGFWWRLSLTMWSLETGEGSLLYMNKRFRNKLLISGIDSSPVSPRAFYELGSCFKHVET